MRIESIGLSREGGGVTAKNDVGRGGEEMVGELHGKA